MLDMKNSKSFIVLPVLIAIGVAILVVGGGAYVYVKNKQVSNPEVVAPIYNATSTAQTAGWKTYTSTKLGISFSYPQSWGDAKESYYDSAHTKNGQGKLLIIEFSNSLNNKYPAIAAASPDYAPYEGYAYKGEKSLQEVYKQKGDYKTDPLYFNLAGNIPALEVFATNANIDMGYPAKGIEVYAKLADNQFSGLSINLKLSESPPQNSHEKNSKNL